MKSRSRKASKKPYHPPKLLVYGDLRTLTLAVGKTGPFDGAPMMVMIKS